MTPKRARRRWSNRPSSRPSPPCRPGRLPRRSPPWPPRWEDERNPELPDRHIEGKPSHRWRPQRRRSCCAPRIGDYHARASPCAPPHRGRRWATGRRTPTDRQKRRQQDGAGGATRGRAQRGPRRSRAGRMPVVAPVPPPARVGRGATGAVVVAAVAAAGPRSRCSRWEVLRRRAARNRRALPLSGDGAGAQGTPRGRYVMCVHVAPKATQIAVLEGRSLVEHYVPPGRRRD